METPVSDQEFQQGGCVCEHLLTPEGADGTDHYYYFSGVKASYHLICDKCYKLPENELRLLLRKTTPEWFVEVDCSHKYGFIGLPEIRERPENLRFQHLQLNVSMNETVVAIQPASAQRWIAVLKSGKIIRLDTDIPGFQIVTDLTTHQFEHGEDILLHVSSQGRFIAVVNRHGQTGVVLDLSESETRSSMRLDRGTYHIRHYEFSVAFFDHADKTHLIHATEWNRLDISDPATGALLTHREYETLQPGQRPAHFLDYFHARLQVSPDQHRIAEDGWVWHPVGETRIWSLSRWLEHNVWESEDGESLHILNGRDYFWDAPLRWIDSTTLAVWGIGVDDEGLLPGIVLYDALTGKRVRMFSGVQRGELYYDKYLFSVSESGTEIWDLETEERLHVEPDFKPLAWNPSTHEFISLLPDGALQLSRLTDH